MFRGPQMRPAENAVYRPTNDFIGNIYNQIVKAITAHFSNVAIPLKSPRWNSEYAKGKGR